MTYKTSLDKEAKFMTVFITILFLVIIAVEIYLIKKTGLFFPILFITLIIATYVTIYFIRPISYIVTENKLIIHRLYNNINIERNNIKSVEKFENTQIGNALRVFGVGGLFGFFGTYYNFKLGKMKYYTTRRNPAVLIRTFDDKKIVITPDNSTDFIAEINPICMVL